MQTAHLFLMALLLLSSQASAAFNFDTFSILHNQNSVNTWASKMHHIFDYKNQDSLTQLCGTQVNEPDTLPSLLSDLNSNLFKPLFPNRLLQTLPANYDLRSVYPSCWSISYIRSQAKCGSCWAVASMSTLSDRYCINKSTADNVVQREFSIEDTLECCSKAQCGSGPNMGCRGGYLKGGFVYALNNGVSSGENFGNFTSCKPYFLSTTANSAPAPSCSSSCTDPTQYTTDYADDLLKISGYNVLTGSNLAQTNSNMQNAIYARGSILTMMYVYMDFFTYSSGVYQKSSTVLAGGHAIRIIGWGTTIVGGVSVNYWIMANSWGQQWGMNGFFWMIRGVNNCNIESQAMEGLII